MFDAELELEAELEKLMAILAESDLESEDEFEDEFESEIPSPPKKIAPTRNHDQVVLAAQTAQGVRDENKLTDAVFYGRHPEWKGKSLKTASLTLRQEWMQIRSGMVRPLLKTQPAVQAPKSPAPPLTPAPQTPLAPKVASTGQFGFRGFENILRHQPDQYAAAMVAQAAYQRVSGFLPWYYKISSAKAGVRISEANEGIGNLAFWMDRGSLANLVEDGALRNKAFEIMAGGMTSELVFSEDVIGALGIGLTMFDIAQGLENHRMIGSIGPDNANWIEGQKLHFVFGLLAEDISRDNWGNGYFASRNSRDLAAELANEYTKFQPVFMDYEHYVQLDDNLAESRSNIPDNPPQRIDLPP